MESWKQWQSMRMIELMVLLWQDRGHSFSFQWTLLTIVIILQKVGYFFILSTHAFRT